MVTYSELFQFCILIVAIINLIVMIFFNHKKPAPTKDRLFFKTNFGKPPTRYCFLYFHNTIA